jgi:hypothetical protein
MPMRDPVRPDKVKADGIKAPADAPESAELLTSREFEIVSWLTATGVLISVILVAAYPAFEPAAALLGQFP